MFRNPSQNYGYLNARLRARLNSFIPAQELFRLSQGTARDLELFLLDSAYAESYRANLVSLEASTLSRIELAISLGSAAKIRDTLRLAQGEARELLKVVTTRSDLHNARLVLRGLFLGRDSSRNPAWHAYGELAPGFFEALWKTTSILDAREKCLANGSPLALALGESLEAKQKGETLPSAERLLLVHFLDHLQGLFKKIGSKGSETALEVMGRMVDLWNIGIWLRKKRVDREEAVAFLPYGKWVTLGRLGSASSARPLIEGTPWIREVKPEILETGSPMALQGEFNIAFWRWQSFLYRRDLLGCEVAISYLSRLLLEWQNLNILAVGLALGHPAIEISRRIIDVLGGESRQ